MEIGLGLLIFTTVVVCIAVFNIRWRSRMKRMAADRNRSGIDEQSFLSTFKDVGVDRTVLVCVYRVFSEFMGNGVDPLPVLASDNIAEVYGFDNEGLEDILNEILEKTGRSWSDYKSNPHISQITTVRDVALFVNAQPMKPDANL